MVEGIERFHSKLHARALSNGKALGQAQVEIAEAWSPQEVPGGGAKVGNRRLSKCGRVKPLAGGIVEPRGERIADSVSTVSRAKDDIVETEGILAVN